MIISLNSMHSVITRSLGYVIIYYIAISPSLPLSLSPLFLFLFSALKTAYHFQ